MATNGNGMKIHGRLAKGTEQITASLEDLQQHLTDCETNINGLQGELKEARNTVASQSREIQKADTRITSLQSDLSLSNERARRFEEDLTRLRESTNATIMDLRGELGQAVDALDNANQVNLDLTDKLEKVTADYKQALGESIRLQKLYDHAQNKLVLIQRELA